MMRQPKEHVTGQHYVYRNLDDAQAAAKRLDGLGIIRYIVVLRPEDQWYLADRRAARQEMDNLALRYGRRCLACEATKHLLVDHIRPLRRDGTSHIDNLQILCRTCNFSKGLRIIDYRPYPYHEDGDNCGYCEAFVPCAELDEMIINEAGGLSDICRGCWPYLIQQPEYRDLNMRMDREIIFPMVA